MGWNRMMRAFVRRSCRRRKHADDLMSRFIQERLQRLWLLGCAFVSGTQENTTGRHFCIWLLSWCLIILASRLLNQALRRHVVQPPYIAAFQVALGRILCCVLPPLMFSLFSVSFSGAVLTSKLPQLEFSLGKVLLVAHGNFRIILAYHSVRTFIPDSPKHIRWKGQRYFAPLLTYSEKRPHPPLYHRQSSKPKCTSWFFFCHVFMSGTYWLQSAVFSEIFFPICCLRTLLMCLWGPTQKTDKTSNEVTWLFFFFFNSLEMLQLCLQMNHRGSGHVSKIEKKTW